MGEVRAASADVESVTVEAVVFRRDGTVEDLGVIAEYQRTDNETTEEADGGENK